MLLVGASDLSQFVFVRPSTTIQIMLVILSAVYFKDDTLISTLPSTLGGPDATLLREQLDLVTPQIDMGCGVWCWG